MPTTPLYDKTGSESGTIDLALLAVNFKLVLPMLEQCAEKGVKFASIFASGFAEAGEEGKVLQQKIADLAKKSGMGICGPNCQGSVSLKERAIGSFSAFLGLSMHRINTGIVGYFRSSGGTYIPNLSEFLISFGVLSIVGLVFLFLLERFHVIDDIAPDESIGWQQTRAADTAGLAVEPEPGSEYHPGEPRLHAD